jgi:L-alanine-DL-glutamate epimerase-like enolase superfamily enzyme
MDFYLGLGFRGLKLGAGSLDGDSWYMPATPSEAADFEADKLEFVRSHVGPDVLVMFDGHMGNSTGATWDLATARAVMQAVEPYNLFFFEEPLHYTDPWGYAELCKSTSIPIAGGECLTAFYEWKIFVEKDCFDIGQPDASFTGGLTEFVRIANLLEERGRKIATHAWGAGGSLMQNIHAGFACANTAVLEVAPDFAGLHSEVIDGSFHMDKGDVLPPNKPGLGIILTDETKNRYPFVPGSGEFISVPGKVLVD